MREIGEVERVAAIDRDAFEHDYVAAGKPLIVEGAVKAWRDFDVWDPDKLQGLLRGVKVRCKFSANGYHPNFLADSMGEMFKVEELPFEQLVTRITAGPVNERKQTFFTGDEQFVYRVRDDGPELNPDLAPLWEYAQVPELLPAERLYSVWSWFSGAGLRSWLHYDNNACENLNAQMRGKKRCWLFSPDQLERLGLFPIGGGNPALNCSQINAFEPDLMRFPEFAQAEALTATVNAGDLFYIPAHWVHCFEHQGAFNANINFWWRAQTLLQNPIAEREAQLAAG